MLLKVLILAALAMLAITPVALAQDDSSGPPPPGATPSPPQADLSGTAPAALSGDLQARFESYIEDAMERHNVPGAAVAVIQEGEVVYEEGFGVTQAGEDSPVTPETLMMVGSTTKSMTSMMAAILVEEGSLSWDTPIQDLLPDFQLADPELTPQLTVADAFCACTGIPRRDMEIVFNIGDLDPRAVITQVANLPITAALGERFQYSNQMYAVGGYALAAAAGADLDTLNEGYADAMRDYVFGPIGMNRSTLSLNDVLESDDYALPHSMGLEAETQEVPLSLDSDFVTSVAPAGAVWSSATEMARYLQTHMANGVAPDGTRVVSQEALERTRDGRIATPADQLGFPPVLAETAQEYAMGWLLGEWNGLELIHHSGGTFGFAAEIAFLPEVELGVVLLTNSTQGGIFNYDVQFRLLELLFDQEPVLGPAAAEFMEAQEAQLEQLQARLRAVDPATVDPYMGRYENPDLGEIELTLTDGTLVMDAGGGLRTEMRALLGEDGQVAGYIFMDPPLVNPAPVVFREGEDGRSELVVTLTGEYVEEALTYVFTEAETRGGQ